MKVRTQAAEQSAYPVPSGSVSVHQRSTAWCLSRNAPAAAQRTRGAVMLHLLASLPVLQVRRLPRRRSARGSPAPPVRVWLDGTPPSASIRDSSCRAAVRAKCGTPSSLSPLHGWRQTTNIAAPIAAPLVAVEDGMPLEASAAAAPGAAPGR